MSSITQKVIWGFILFFMSISISLAQEGKVVEQDSTIKENSLSINEISSETEFLRTRIKNLREVLKPNSKTMEVDSILDSAHVSILIEKDSLYNEIELLSRRELKIREVTWKDFKGKLKSVQIILNNRTEEVKQCKR